MIRVDIVGHIRDLFDRPSYSFEAKGRMTVRDLLGELAKYAGPGYGAMVYDTGSRRINEHVTVFVNAKEIRALDGPDTRLKDGDVITILPPMAGG